MNNNPIIMSQATATMSDDRREAIVILGVLGYSTSPYVGPEVKVLADTPYGGIKTVTLPASMVEVYTIFDDEPVDYDRM